MPLSFRQRLPSFLRDVWAWFVRGKRIWWAFAAPLLALVATLVVVPLWGWQIGISGAAFILQAGGLLMVAIELHRTLREFDSDPRTVRQRLCDYFKSFPYWRIGATDTSGRLAGIGMAGAAGSVEFAGPVPETIPERLAPLEADVRRLKTELAKTTRDLSKHKSDVAALLAEQAQKQEEARKEAAERIRALATGGLPAQAISWGWVALGTVSGSGA